MADLPGSGVIVEFPTGVFSWDLPDGTFEVVLPWHMTVSMDGAEWAKMCAEIAGLMAKAMVEEAQAEDEANLNYEPAYDPNEDEEESISFNLAVKAAPCTEILFEGNVVAHFLQRYPTQEVVCPWCADAEEQGLIEKPEKNYVFTPNKGEMATCVQCEGQFRIPDELGERVHGIVVDGYD